MTECCIISTGTNSLRGCVSLMDMMCLTFKMFRGVMNLHQAPSHFKEELKNYISN